jgi:ferritin
MDGVVFSMSTKPIDYLSKNHLSNNPLDKSHWTLADIPFERIDHSKIQHDENLFFVLAGASLVESGSDIYTELLVDHFGAHTEVAAWLTTQWESEELQHGQALRLYIQHAWPDFDWSETRRKFLAEYSTYCTPLMLEPSRALELAARCVVETGTAALYRALHDYTEEPVLKQLAGNIWSDEVNHYKHFYRYFNEYNQTEKNGRWKVSKTLARRLAEIRNEDADCAVRHIFGTLYPTESCNSNRYRAASAGARTLVTHNMTSEMMIKMFLKPLDLPVRLRPYVQRPLTKVMQRFLTA